MEVREVERRTGCFLKGSSLLLYCRLDDLAERGNRTVLKVQSAPALEGRRVRSGGNVGLERGFVVFEFTPHRVR